MTWQKVMYWNGLKRMASFINALASHNNVDNIINIRCFACASKRKEIKKNQIPDTPTMAL